MFTLHFIHSIIKIIKIIYKLNQSKVLKYEKDKNINNE